MFMSQCTRHWFFSSRFCLCLCNSTQHSAWHTNEEVCACWKCVVWWERWWPGSKNRDGHLFTLLLMLCVHLMIFFPSQWQAKEKPLKTNLELITRYFLDHSGSTDNLNQETPIPALPVPKKNNKLSSRCSETTLVNIYDLSDEDTGRRMSWSEAGKARYPPLPPPLHSA